MTNIITFITIKVIVIKKYQKYSDGLMHKSKTKAEINNIKEPKRGLYQTR